MMADVKLSDQQYRQAIDFIVNAQRYRFPIERAHIDTLLEILLTPKQAAADEMAKALTEANAWISRGDGLSPAKRGATCDTLNEAVEMIESALAKAGRP